MSVLTMLGVAAALASTPPAKGTHAVVFTESTAPGRIVGPEDSVVLCARDDAGAKRAMEDLAIAAHQPRGRDATACTVTNRETWRVVRAVAHKCLPAVEGDWCEVEAHAVVIERSGKRRYAVIIVTAEQLD